MALPDRPVDGAEIATDWGQEIHDRVLAASGCDVWSSTANTVGGTINTLPLNMTHEDPGGYLVGASNRVDIPTGKEGLYLLIARLNAVNGATTTDTRGTIYLNGSEIARALEDNNAGTNITVTVVALYYLSAGDQLQVRAIKRGTGTSPDVNVSSFQLLRITDNYGA